MQGKIKMIQADKGWGFIAGDDKVDYFFHKRHLNRNVSIDELEVGDVVTFEEATGPKGPYAEDVSIA